MQPQPKKRPPRPLVRASIFLLPRPQSTLQLWITKTECRTGVHGRVASRMILCLAGACEQRSKHFLLFRAAGLSVLPVIVDGGWLAGAAGLREARRRSALRCEGVVKSQLQDSGTMMWLKLEVHRLPQQAVAALVVVTGGQTLRTRDFRLWSNHAISALWPSCNVARLPKSLTHPTLRFVLVLAIECCQRSSAFASLTATLAGLHVMHVLTDLLTCPRAWNRLHSNASFLSVPTMKHFAGPRRGARLSTRQSVPVTSLRLDLELKVLHLVSHSAPISLSLSETQCAFSRFRHVRFAK